jgi:uncharacterized protein (DUF2249 family)
LKYSWKEGVNIFRNRDAQKIGEELELIETLKPKNVVRYAEQHKDSELYKCFEWNNEKAGNAWRREQARGIIQLIVITETVKENGVSRRIKIRAFENANDGDDGSVYIPTHKALEDTEYRKCVLESIRRGIEELSEKGRNYEAVICNSAAYQKGLAGAMKALKAKPRKGGAMAARF